MPNLPSFANFDWETLLESISDDWCTPILGPEVCTGTLHQRQRIASKLCQDKKVFALTSPRDLVQVSQYLSVTARNPKVWRDSIVALLRGDTSTPDFNKPNEPHVILAKLKLSVYATTNLNNYMAEALRRRPAKVHKELCPWREDLCPWNTKLFGSHDPSFEMPLRDPAFELSPAEPVVFHLFGNVSAPESMVLSEDDHLDFLARVSGSLTEVQSSPDQDHSVLPNKLVKKLRSDYLLFLGYQVNDFDFHILIRSLRSLLSLNSSRVNPLIAVQIEDPEATYSKDRAQLMEWLRDYKNDLEKSVDDGSGARAQRMAQLSDYLGSMEKAEKQQREQVTQLRQYLESLCLQHKLQVAFGTCADFLQELNGQLEARAVSDSVVATGEKL